ncbi:MAG: PAS domain S-box protein, partial [Deltaproteobacteria bacterium]|nr:PAS domain S-box protein [Deltaproteobacteria bacterium]
AAILGVFFSISLARIFSRTIWVLAEQAKKIGMGGFDQKVVYHSKDALGRLSASFNKMAEELKLTINRLEENEEKYHALFEASNDAVFMMDEEKFLECNDYTCEMFGCAREDIIGQSPIKFSPPAQPDGSLSEESAAEKISAAFNGENQRFYWRHIRLDGSAFDAEVTLNPTHIANKAVLQTIVQDISERKLAEEKIKDYSENLERMVEERTDELNIALTDAEQARDKIDGIVKSVSDGLIVTDINNSIILMNYAAEELLGIRYKDVFNRPIDFAIKEKTLREKVRETIDKKATGYQFDFELQSEEPGHPKIMQARTSVIYDKESSETGIVTILHDVTHEREVDRMKTEFISTAAHELRTPLTSIQGFSEILLMREDLKPEERKKFLTHINKQSVGLAAIINDLLDISRIESGRSFALNKAPCNAGDAIDQIILYFEENYKEHRFETVLSEKAVPLIIDKEKMGQVLKNLVGNAVKYSPGGGLIRVSGEQLGDHYQVSVEDQGMGMTPEQIDKVFDKFYRVDASNTAIEGTGLGMTIVKHIVEAHGGKVRIESELGKGTSVRFTIPT